MSENFPNKSHSMESKTSAFARRREPLSIRRFTNHEKTPKRMFFVGTLGRTFEVSRPAVASERRPRASERRRPTSLLRALFDRRSKERRGAFSSSSSSSSIDSSFRAHGSIPIDSIRFVRSFRPRLVRFCASAVRIASRARPRGEDAHLWDDAAFDGWRRDARLDWMDDSVETLVGGWMDPDPGGLVSRRSAMRRRRVGDRGGDGGCVVVRRRASTRSEAVVYEVLVL